MSIWGGFLKLAAIAAPVVIPGAGGFLTAAAFTLASSAVVNKGQFSESDLNFAGTQVRDGFSQLVATSQTQNESDATIDDKQSEKKIQFASPFSGNSSVLLDESLSFSDVADRSDLFAPEPSADSFLNGFGADANAVQPTVVSSVPMPWTARMVDSATRALNYA